MATPADNDNDENYATPAFRSIPCGSDSRFAAATAENIKFIQPSLLGIPSVSSLTQRLLLDFSYLSRILSPPDPPPKLS